MIVVSAAFLVWSGIAPVDRGVWVFENVPGVVGVTILCAVYHRFRFSGLVYGLVAFHFAILAIGGKYTYALNPVFEWLRETLNLARNHYDRVGHFAQGFFPAIVVREVLIRTSPLERGKWVFFLSTAVCLAFSAIWELIEWWMVILLYPDQGPAWLGTQGDAWDAQQDMFMALSGAVLSLLVLSRLHDRSMERNAGRTNAGHAEQVKGG